MTDRKNITMSNLIAANYKDLPLHFKLVPPSAMEAFDQPPSPSPKKTAAISPLVKSDFHQTETELVMKFYKNISKF